MRETNRSVACLVFVVLLALPPAVMGLSPIDDSEIGREVAIPRHLEDGEEFRLSLPHLVEFGRKLFMARWTIQEGAGRPLTKGTGDPLSDPSNPLVFPRNFNRISAPDSNSCAGCHNTPFVGGGGDIVSKVFVLGQRFDFLTFDRFDTTPTGSAVDELGNPVTQQSSSDSRKTIGMDGSGFIEMLARQITVDLQSVRDAMPRATSRHLVSKGISFGVLTRNSDGTWDTSQVEGLAAPSLASSGADHPPSLLIRPFHQAGVLVSIRHFTNNAFNHHHGIQSTERFGIDTDPDGDGVTNELTRADVTAATIFQVTLGVPGRVIPNDPTIERAVRRGERLFSAIGCANCHIPSLPLDRHGWIYTEPNPFNPPGNLRPADGVPTLSVDLTSDQLPGPRLKPDHHGVVEVPAFTDFKLHNICAGPSDPNVEPLDQQEPAGSQGFFAGNPKFITRKLWGTANSGPFMHHGQFTTMREAILAHAGEAQDSSQAFRDLSPDDRGSVIEFLKTLQVLPPGTRHLIVDENGRKKHWESEDSDSDD